MRLIDKDAVVAKIERMQDAYIAKLESRGMGHEEAVMASISYVNGINDVINSLEVKNDSLENFKSLQHISRDLKSTLQDWGYAPNLYFCDGMWHVSWISCEDGDGIKDFEGNTPEEAIDKACNWFHSTFCNS